MTEHFSESSQDDGAILPDDLLAARDRVARGRARAKRAINRGRVRRRYLPQILAVSMVLLTLGAADRFVQGAIPASTVSTTAVTTTRSGSTSAATQTLTQLSQTLAADQRAIDALAAAQARLARSAQGDGGGPSAGSAIQLPTLPPLGAVPNVTVPAATSIPTVSATTGASVVVP